MKMLLFKVVLVVGMMLMVPYYLLGGGTMPTFLQGMFKSGKDAVSMKNVSAVTTDKAITLYKCTGDNGLVEFSQSPCLGEGETITLEPNVNVVQRTKIPDQEEEESSGPGVITIGGRDKENDQKDKKEGGLELGNPYDPENVQKLIKDAKNVGKLIEQHTKQIDNATGQQN